MALQAKRDAHQAEVHDLVINRHVPRAKDPGKGNIVMIIVKKHRPRGSYLSNRLQYIQIDENSRPEFCVVKRGVPQGSILGPLLMTSKMHNVDVNA